MPLTTETPGFVLTAASEFAQFATQRAAGNYEALGLEAAWQQAWGQVQAHWAAYRILHNGLAQRGIGDLNLGSQFVILNEPNSVGRLGLQLALHAPTGDPVKQLGMGHWMVMPGLWWQLGAATRYLITEATYGHSLAASSHHHTGAGPLVAPMNSSELNLSVHAGLQLAEHTDVRAGAALALPLIAKGSYRSDACLAFVEHPSRLLATLEGCVPLAGDAFEWKLRSAVGWRF